MTIGNVTDDGHRTSTAAVPPEARRPYVAPFLRHLDFSDTCGSKTPDDIEASFTVGPS